MTDTHELAGRSAVVTGASSGIGRAIAERLGACGAYVVLCGRTDDAMAESIRKIEETGGSATSVVGDLRDPAVVTSLVDAAVSKVGHLDIFVNNAGVMFTTPIIDADVEQWRLMLDTNVLALLVGCQAAIRSMRSTGTPGRIVNISSIAAQERGSGVYGATKHAVNVISSSLRLELIDDPIQIVTVMPGVIATNIARTFDPAVLEGMVALTGLDVEIRPGERVPDELLEQAQIALADFIARPEDVAEAVRFAVTRPAGVHIAEIVVRPNKDLEF